VDADGVTAVFANWSGGASAAGLGGFAVFSCNAIGVMSFPLAAVVSGTGRASATEGSTFSDGSAAAVFAVSGLVGDIMVSACVIVSSAVVSVPDRMSAETAAGVSCDAGLLADRLAEIGGGFSP
jgi:hypothetical protein